ncbi:DUF5336 domain-containing protein [Prauserella muralis]|uniref:Uncharacterized protein n=1 Tax=Prauserella muralis TaxID=588067 RepID=A0A2V4BNS3_9PSEU|nr:DUF5336 domain-containing protein [Prauserella muralis]PXY32273.1 hypothetical protein BAY60_08310 [Prauserella muralis]TWE24055.1 hypothetical protein FHX69_5362 [Prauserella muralis]
MTFPSGAPGGFPGQGPQQPHQPFPGAGPSMGGGPKLALPQILLLGTAGLGVLNLFLAFANVSGGRSFFEAGYGWIPGLLLVSGLTALFSILPGDQKPGPWPAAIAAGVMLPFLFTVFQSDADLQAGGIMLLIFGIVQLAASVGAYLFDAGILKAPAPQQMSPYGHQQQPFGQQQPGGFGQQPPPFGQQPAPDASGGIPQPTKFAQPVGQQQPTQQPTQYASQQGQFFQQQQQQQPQDGGQQNKPGTPPGGFGQSGA